MDLFDLVIGLLVRWLCPPAPWWVRSHAQAWWLDGLGKGAVIGGAAALASVVLARLILWLGGRLIRVAARLLRWLVRKRDRR